MKSCSRCGEEKGLEEFYKDRRARDGRKSECIACQSPRDRAYSKTPKAIANARARGKRYRERNAKKLKEIRRASYRRHHEKRLAGMAKWRAENPEKAKASKRRWAKANRQRKLELQQAYAKRHPKRILTNARRQEMKRRGNGDSVSPEGREFLTILENDPCSYCGAPKEEFDHIDSRRQWNLDISGWNHWMNLTSACKRCNGEKYDKPLLTFLLERAPS